MKGDLHCHTRLSDGSEGVEDVIALAKRSGLDFVSLTDHDTMASFPRAKVLGERYGIRTIPGVEFSAFDEERGRKVHILCYLPQKPDRLEKLCVRAAESRRQVGSRMAKLVMQKYPITAEAILKYASASGGIFKQHIVRALMDAGFTTTIYGDLYRELFGRGGSCLVTYRYPDVYEVLELVRESGGVAVLAHPSVYRSMELFDELAEQGLLDGVEAFHPRNSEEDVAVCLKTAEQKGLIVTGGSDFHGMYSSGDDSFVGSRTVGEESLKGLLARANRYKERV